MEQAHSDIVAAGLQNIVVAIGEPKHAQRYCPNLAPSARCLCSPDSSAYADFGARQGTRQQLMGLQVFAKGIMAGIEGHKQGATTGDQKMLGGTFVIDAQGMVRYVHYDDHPGDYPPVAEVLQAVKK